MNVSDFMENHHVPLAFAAAEIAACEDMWDGTKTSKVIGMKNWGAATLIVGKTTGATGTTLFTVESCDDFTPSTPTAIAFKYRVMTTNDTFGAWQRATTAGFTTTAGADQVYEIHVAAEDLKDGDVGVRFKAVEQANDPVHGFMLCVLSNGKYPQSIPKTVLE